MMSATSVDFPTLRHWPPTASRKPGKGGGVRLAVIILILILILILSTGFVDYRFVDRPFDHRSDLEYVCFAGDSVSNLRMRSANSGRRANQAYCSLNFSSGRAGVPQTV